jgi:hypothetical protein
MARPLWILAAIAATASLLQAHPADIVQLRVGIERRALDLRFTLNLPCLSRLTAIDADNDGRVTPAELEAARPALTQALQRQVRLEINDRPAEFGTITRVETLWPKGSQAPADDPGRRIDLHFHTPQAADIDSFSLAFDLFESLGPLASVEAEYAQNDLRLHVPFTVNARRYRHVTGFAAEAYFQEPAAANRRWPWITSGLLLAGLAALGLGMARRQRA